MRVAIRPVSSPTRNASDHFKNMYCSTWADDLLLQSCLKRSFSLILHPPQLFNSALINVLQFELSLKNRRGDWFLVPTHSPSSLYERPWPQLWPEDWRRVFGFSSAVAGSVDCFPGPSLPPLLLPPRLRWWWLLFLQPGLDLPPSRQWKIAETEKPRSSDGDGDGDGGDRVGAACSSCLGIKN